MGLNLAYGEGFGKEWFQNRVVLELDLFVEREILEGMKKPPNMMISTSCWGEAYNTIIEYVVL